MVRKNIKTNKLSDKLDYRKLGPFIIKKVRKAINYELQLLKNMKIYLVFYISLLELALHNALKALYIEIKLINLNAKYKVKKILNYKYIKNKIKYLIK